MIKIENGVYPDSSQMEFIIRGMRNPMNSWDKSDSVFFETMFDGIPYSQNNKVVEIDGNGDGTYVGDNDLNLMKRLCKAGTDHRKFMRMMTVYVDITAPLYWWKEFDTYKVGTVANSCSTMHKIHEKEFTIDDFSHEHLMEDQAFSFPLGGGWRGLDAREVLQCTIEGLNNARKRYLITKDKIYWWQMIQLLPSSYNQKRSVMLNYEVLANMYKSRKNHKLDEWRDFCRWMEDLPFSYLITGEEN